ncbi:MAG: sugar phosphotransferase [Leptospiraceae bacterium]|nr:sugar phosphotransferase [Leptospiraceae bacterium]
MHELPTKKSAGLVFMGVFTISLFHFIFHSTVDEETVKILIQLVPGLIVFLLIGFLDDRYNFSSRRKLFFEIIFFIPYIYLFFPDFQVFGFAPPLHKLFYSIVLAGYIIFVTNLCNFMDGLDLYLTFSALTSLIIFFFMVSNIPITNVITLNLLIVCLGSFIFFNFPPARLFMGDTGSLPLGYMIAILPFLGDKNNTPDLGYGFLLIPVFWIDGVFTILRRLIRKENIFRAHREHLYQKITLAFLDKRLTTIIFSLWNLFIIPFYFLTRDSLSFLFICILFLLLNSVFYFYFLKRVS